jgi:hypothetical protein
VIRDLRHEILNLQTEAAYAALAHRDRLSAESHR